MEENKNKGNINNVQHKKNVHPSGEHANKTGKMQYRNLILMFLALVLFVYAGLISIVPSIITSTFNSAEFAVKFSEATSLKTNLDGFQYRISPNLHATIELNNLKLAWVGDQDLFEAKIIEIETKNPLAIFTKNYDIESVSISNAHYSDQLIPDDKTQKLINKLNKLLPNFNPNPFGTSKIKIVPGKVTFKNFKISYITPETYNEDTISQKTFSKPEVKKFLTEYPVGNVNIK